MPSATDTLTFLLLPYLQVAVATVVADTAAVAAATVAVVEASEEAVETGVSVPHLPTYPDAVPDL